MWKRLRRWMPVWRGVMDNALEVAESNRRSVYYAAIYEARKSMREMAVRECMEARQKATAARKQCKKDIEKINETARRVIEKCVDIRFNRERHDQYGIQLTFTPRLFGYGAHREDIEFVAEQVAGMVQNEIASCRFVKSASNVERERREREVGGNIFGTREAADAAGGE